MRKATSHPGNDLLYHTWSVFHVCVRGSKRSCVSRPAFSCERRVRLAPVWTAGGEHYLRSLRRPVSRASVWGTCKLPSLEYLFTKQMFLSRAITFGLHFPVAHWYRWMCIQRRPRLCMEPLGATHHSPHMRDGQAGDRLACHGVQPKTQNQLHCGNWRKWRRHLLQWPCSDGKMACISFSPPGCSFALETERKREEAWSGETMHASVLPSVWWII